jgi:hypothetical protein
MENGGREAGHHAITPGFKAPDTDRAAGRRRVGTSLDSQARSPARDVQMSWNTCRRLASALARDPSAVRTKGSTAACPSSAARTGESMRSARGRAQNRSADATGCCRSERRERRTEAAGDPADAEEIGGIHAPPLPALRLPFPPRLSLCPFVPSGPSQPAAAAGCSLQGAPHLVCWWQRPHWVLPPSSFFLPPSSSDHARRHAHVFGTVP